MSYTKTQQEAFADMQRLRDENDEFKRRRVLKLLADGTPLHVAAKRMGVSAVRVKRWRKEAETELIKTVGQDFYDAVMRGGDDAP